LFRPAVHPVQVVEEAISLRDALQWMNIHLELLAVNKEALMRMRDLVAGSSLPDHLYREDVQLVMAEVDRVLDRLGYWEEMVDRSNGAARLRPILAGLGIKP
jgi:hypothetical protein